MERKSFESKMKQEYKLKKERWKREMAEVDTPKRQREAVLSQHKENFKEMDATETQRMTRNQKEVLDREVRKFRRRRLVKYHELEQDLLREVRIVHTCVWKDKSTYKKIPRYQIGAFRILALWELQKVKFCPYKLHTFL